MKRSLLVLLLAILAPAVLLGWLALRSTHEQQIILERRTAELYQTQTDALAVAARSLVSEQRRAFAENVRQLLTENSAAILAPRFSSALAARWKQPAVGFALDRQGHLLAPTAADAAQRLECQQFLRDNREFIGNQTAATVYPVQMDELKRPEVAQRSKVSQAAEKEMKMPMEKKEQQFRKVAPQGSLILNNANAAPNASIGFNGDNGGNFGSKTAQQIEPPESQLTWSTAAFRQVIAEDPEGVVNRFVHDRLNMIFWVRPAEAHDFVFGCLLRTEDLRGSWPELFGPPESFDPELIVALLDDNAKPVAMLPRRSSVPDWKRPFVATEIGEALPHWEAALYLRHPENLEASAQKLQRNLFLLISCALLAIAVGGWVVFADTRRQLALAQKKTDFVSNVSHELKTPLTSIRMFAEMMHSGRAEAARQPQYLRIIMVEAERLTRLINNVLDFARLERKQRRFEKRPADLHAVLADLWPAQELHLHEAGFTTHWEAAPPPYSIVGDEDALAQAIVNLISNAEKYGGERKEITLHSFLEGAWACVSILDRGAGVPAGEEAKIFEPFYRAHDSLSSGIPGTGLGLALARRVVREHGGEILYQVRPGGGSNFTIRLPLAHGDAPVPRRPTEEFS